jgi:hypothetical protein
VLKQAFSRSDSIANLSLHSEEGKLRWSELLELHNDFILVAPRRRSRSAFSLYWRLCTARHAPGPAHAGPGAVPA